MDDAAVLKRRGYIMGINLGEGSYAKVKSAYSERLKFNVAVKIIDRKKAPTDFLEKFLPREIEILAMLNHRSIVKTYEIFETSDGKVYIVMELGVQGDLLEFIKTRGALQEDDARKKFHQLSSAIKYCHDLDVVHRDLKCENLLLDKDFNIKLSDFGFSKRCLAVVAPFSSPHSGQPHGGQFTSEDCAHLPGLSQRTLSSSKPSGTKQCSVACFCEFCL